MSTTNPVLAHDMTKKSKRQATLKAARKKYSQSKKGKENRARFEKRRSWSLSRRFGAGKRDVRKRHLEFSLTLDEWTLIIREPCYYCSYQLGAPTTKGLGLDRLDNTKGYIKENVVSCCKVCNSLKSDSFTPEETKIMVGALLVYRKDVPCTER